MTYRQTSVTYDMYHHVYMHYQVHVPPVHHVYMHYHVHVLHVYSTVIELCICVDPDMVIRTGIHMMFRYTRNLVV